MGKRKWLPICSGEKFIGSAFIRNSTKTAKLSVTDSKPRYPEFQSNYYKNMYLHIT